MLAHHRPLIDKGDTAWVLVCSMLDEATLAKPVPR